MTGRRYRWFVKPLTDAANEHLAAALAREGLAAESEYVSIVVRGKTVRGVYCVPFPFITMLERSETHRNSYRAFVQEGEGEKQEWDLYKRQRARTRRTKQYKKAEATIPTRKASE